MKVVGVSLWVLSAIILFSIVFCGVLFGLGWNPPSTWRIEPLLLSLVVLSFLLFVFGFTVIGLEEHT